MDKEKWIQKIMESAGNKAPADLPQDFEQRLMQRIANRKSTVPVVSMKWIASAACAASLIFLLNISVLNKWKKNAAQSTQSSMVSTGTPEINNNSPENLNQDYNFFN